MKKITKDQLEQIAESFLMQLNQQKDHSSQLADETQTILNNPEDYFLFASILIANAIPSQLDDDSFDMKAKAMSYMKSGVEVLAEHNVIAINDNSLSQLLSKNCDFVVSNYKLNFAFNQFVLALREYDKLNAKYSELFHTINQQ